MNITDINTSNIPMAAKKSCRDLLTLCCGFCFNEDCIFVGACVLAAGVAVENDNAPKFFK